MDRVDKYKRHKYVRELEKFTNKIVNFLKKEDISKDDLKEYVDKIFTPLQEVEKVFLKNSYLKALESFVQKSANIWLSKKDIEDIKKETLLEANALRKLKRVKKYNRKN